MIEKSLTLPGFVDIGHHFSLGRHVSRSIAEPELCLKGVKVGLELGLLLYTRWLVLATISSVFLEFLLTTCKRIVGLTTSEPRHRSSYPFQQVRGQTLVFLHKPLVLLIHLQNLADSVCRSFGLQNLFESFLQQEIFLITRRYLLNIIRFAMYHVRRASKRFMKLVSYQNWPFAAIHFNLLLTHTF